MPKPSLEEKRNIITNVLYYSLIAAAAVLGLRLTLRWLLPALYPFVIAYVLSLALNPAMLFLKRKAGLPKGAGAFLLVTAATAVFFLLAFLAVRRAASEIGRLASWLSSLTPEDLKPLKARIFSLLERLPFVDAEELWQSAEERLQSFLSAELPSLSDALSVATGLFTGLLDFLLTFVVTLVSCYYMTVDRAQISALVYKLCPQSVGKNLRRVRVTALRVLGRYLKAYGIIVAVTFTELFAAFTVLRLDYALLLAAVVAFVDILPVLGTGTVLIPWALACFFATRNIYLGAGLLVTYVVVTVIRQVMEPKVVGRCIGLHPLAAMAAMFAGLKLFGILGMLFLPLALLTATTCFGSKRAPSPKTQTTSFGA